MNRRRAGLTTRTPHLHTTLAAFWRRYFSLLLAGRQAAAAATSPTLSRLSAANAHTLALVTTLRAGPAQIGAGGASFWPLCWSCKSKWERERLFCSVRPNLQVHAEGEKKKIKQNCSSRRGKNRFSIIAHCCWRRFLLCSGGGSADEQLRREGRAGARKGQTRGPSLGEPPSNQSIHLAPA